MAFSPEALFGYALEWVAFVAVVGLSLSRVRHRNVPSEFEVPLLACMLATATAAWILANTPSGPDITFYAKALVGFVRSPLSFYPSFAPYVYPPLQLFLAAIPYLLALPPLVSLRLVSVVANLVSGLLVYLLLGRGTKGLMGAALLLFNPFYAQYSIVNLTSEALTAPFLLLALLVFRAKGASGVLVGVSAAAKQQALYPALVLFLKRIPEEGLSSLRFLVGAILAFTLISLPFLFSTPTFYLSAITERALEYQNLSPGQQGGAAAFSTFWSAMSWISAEKGINLGAAQALRPVVWALLVGVVVFLVLRRELSPSYAALLGYVPYILGSEFQGGWYLIVFVPLFILVYLDSSLSSAERCCALFVLFALLPYRLADVYSLLTGNSPPYVIGDLLLGIATTCFVVVALLKRPPVAKAQGIHPNAG